MLQTLSSGPPVDDQPFTVLSTFAIFTRQMRELGPANMILAADGHLLVHTDRRTQRPGVIEPPGLWILRRSCPGENAERITGAGIDFSHSALHVVLVASVPLSDEPWQPLGRGCTLAITRGQVIESVKP